MTLHTINKQTSDCVSHCLNALAENDTVLLIEDGVYAAMTGCSAAEHWQQLPDGVTCLALADELAAGGIRGQIAATVQPASWEEFVALCTRHDKVISWG